MKTPLENISKTHFSKIIKKGGLKGTKFFYMDIRMCEEDIYLWI